MQYPPLVICRRICGENLHLRGFLPIITARVAAIMAYIHEIPGWPKLKWDNEALSAPLIALRHKQGRLLGRMEALGTRLRTETHLSSLTEEVVATSAIEGEILDPDEVRSSVARRLRLDAAGLPRPSREVEGVVELMLDATRNCDQPLTADRLFGWHTALFPVDRTSTRDLTVGAWRTGRKGAMRVISGSIGREKEHFRAPDATLLEEEMNGFLVWFASPPPLDPVLKAGVAHLWFVTIHPFEDGNGRIARAIADMVLAQADGHRERAYTMSKAIETHRKEYYRQLESAQRGTLDITGWLLWFLDCLDKAIVAAEDSLQAVLHKASFWQALSLTPLNERQRTILNRMLDNFEGHLTTSKYATLAKCSTDTALRDIKDLLSRGILLKNSPGGRSTSYRLSNPHSPTP